jgi:transposase
MVSAVRHGDSIRNVASRSGVGLATVQLWVARAAGQRLDRVDWSDRSAGCPRAANRTTRETEALVLELRQQLKAESDLGEFGAEAIYRELQARGQPALPSSRTIGRILERHGALDGRHRTRRPPPPPGWYLSELAAGLAELDSFDGVEGLVIKGGPGLEVLNAISLHGKLAGSWPFPDTVTAARVIESLTAHWQRFGLPTYAQFDNDPVFHGPLRHRDLIGRVSRFCLACGVIPVFAPPRETGFQAAIENYNGRWQAKVWARFHFESMTQLQTQSDKFVAALNRRHAALRDAAPPRKPFPETFDAAKKTHLAGQIIYLRRTDEKGCVKLLGQRFEADKHWLHRLVRCEVDLTLGNVKFFALRRREPKWQPLLREFPYQIRPKR